MGDFDASAGRFARLPATPDRLRVVPIRARERLAQARLYLVCDELPDAQLRAALAGGVDLVQLRMKSAPDHAVLDAAQRYKAICAEHGALLILNDRPDLAERADVDGVHLGQDDVSVAAVRALLGHDPIIGLSTHTPAEIDAARRIEVDYLGVGPVHATPTKPGRAAVGTELVTYAAAHFERPFFAIGGIDAGNVETVLRAGARRIAVVRAIAAATDPERAARELREAIDRYAGLPAGAGEPVGG